MSTPGEELPAAIAVTSATGDGAATVARGLLRCTRPGQWVKNLLVIAVPFAARGLGDDEVLADTAAAVLAFAIVSAGTYLLNDARDVERDRVHPHKRSRPVAAGVVPAALAAWVGAALLLAGIAAAWATSSALGIVVVAYVAITSLYSAGLKHLPWLEIAAVAAGFALRAIAGAAATGLPASGSFLLVIASGATFIVLGKRYAEVTLLTDLSGAHRPVLARYSARVLLVLFASAAVVLCVGYTLWGLHRGHGVGRVLDVASLLPVAYGLGRYGLLVSRGAGGAPEEVLTHDRGMVAAIAGWVVVFGAGLVWG